jgi:PAS domain S-box-containing protein
MDQIGVGKRVLHAPMAPGEVSSLVIALLRYSNCGIGYVSKSLVVLAANEIIARYVGQPLEMIVGRHAGDLPGWSLVRDLFAQVGETRRPVNAEAVPRKLPEGGRSSTTYWNFTLIPVLDDDNLTGYLLRLQDVTDTRIASIESARLLAQWEALFDTIPDPIFMNDAPDHVVAANRAARDLLGIEPAENLSGDLKGLTPLVPMMRPDGSPLPDEERPSYRALKGERFTNYLCRMRNVKGKEFFVSYAGGQVRPVEGMPARSFVIGRDVTELVSLRQRLTEVNRQLELALQESESRTAEWQAIFEGLSEAIYLADENGKVVAINKAGLNLGGFAYEDVVGKNATEVYQFARITRVEGGPVADGQNPIERTLASGRFDNLSYRFVNRVGQEIEVLSSGGKIPTPRGDRFFFIARDVTEVRRLERARQEFMLVVSHELRNPLQVIKGLSQVIRLRLGSALAGDVSKHLDMLDERIASVSRLLEDILLAYQAGTGRLAFQFRPVNILDVLADSVTPYVLAGTHEVSIDAGGLSEVTVLCDRDRVAQILANLLSNATKYTPTGKRVEVKVGVVDGGYAMVRVEDEGIGIPADQLEKVFEGFYRAGYLAGWKSGGIGLGLHISREFARRHGGDLWAENRPEGGTRLCLKLPLHR